MKLYVFDDRRADEWLPFTLSRPCGELLFGTMTLRQRLERFAGTEASGSISRPWLTSFSEGDAPPVVPAAGLDRGSDRLFLSSRAVPAGAEAPGEEWLAEPTPLQGASIAVEGTVLRHVWELVEGASERTAADLEHGTSDVPEARSIRAEKLGSSPLLLAEDVRIEPGVLFDLREGPICLDRGVEVLSGTRLAGPLYAGPHSRLLGGSLSGLTAGPFSFLRGEIEASVVLGYTNKAHDGFLGHAYLGRWVNLGALTTNSDLKNTYGTVRLAGPEEETDTGLMKFGCLVGDHVKTAIGTLITTGAVIGCGSNLFGGTPGKWVPPFQWGDSGGVHRREGFLRTAGVAAGRRGVPFGDQERAWLSEVWEQAVGGSG